jgi:hypothetical protein
MHLLLRVILWVLSAILVLMFSDLMTETPILNKPKSLFFYFSLKYLIISINLCIAWSCIKFVALKIRNTFVLRLMWYAAIARSSILISSYCSCVINNWSDCYCRVLFSIGLGQGVIVLDAVNFEGNNPCKDVSWVLLNWSEYYLLRTSLLDGGLIFYLLWIMLLWS